MNRQCLCTDIHRLSPSGRHDTSRERPDLVFTAEGISGETAGGRRRRVPARHRGPESGGGGGRRAVSREDRPLLWRLRRRRRVLRAVRFPDHPAVVARGRSHRQDLVAALLGAARPTAAAGVVRGRGRHGAGVSTAVGADRASDHWQPTPLQPEASSSTSCSPAGSATTSRRSSGRRLHRCCTSGRWRSRSSSICSGHWHSLRYVAVPADTCGW